MATKELVLAGRDMVPVIEGELQRDPALASRHTRRTYRGALADFENWRAGRPMTKTTVQEYAAHMQGEGLAPATVNHRLSAVRWWARRVADLAAEQVEDPERRREIVAQAERVAAIDNVRGMGEQRGRHVADGEVRALLQVCTDDKGPIGVRDAAMLALAVATGMRRAEISGLELGDLAEIEGGEGYAVTVHGKGNKVREVAVYHGARDYLRDWLALRGSAQGPLFLAVRKGGAIQDHGIGTQSMEERLRRRATQAGVTRVGWHDFRRTLAGNLLDAGTDLATVQRILGHASPVTTSAYDRRPDATRRKALRAMHVPYLRR